MKKFFRNITLRMLSLVSIASLVYFTKQAYSQQSVNPRAPIITSFSNTPTTQAQVQLPAQSTAQYAIDYQAPAATLNYPTPYVATNQPTRARAIQQSGARATLPIQSQIIRRPAPGQVTNVLPQIQNGAYSPQQVVLSPRVLASPAVRGALSASQAATGLRMLGPATNPAGTLASTFYRPSLSRAPQPQIVPPGITGSAIRGPISPAPAGGAGTPGILTR